MDQAFIQITEDLTELFHFEGRVCPGEGSAEYLCSARMLVLNHISCVLKNTPSHVNLQCLLVFSIFVTVPVVSKLPSTSRCSV